MNRSPVLTIYKKEMLDTIRDRRTLISMVVVPLAAIPLLFLVMSKFVSSSEKIAGNEAAAIAVRNADRLPGLLNALAQAGFKLATRDDIKAAIERKEIAAGVEPVELPGQGKIEVRVYADLTRRSSEVASGRIRAALAAFRQDSIRLKLTALGLPVSIADPFAVKPVNIAPEKKMAGLFWGSMVGYFVVLLMFTGGMYPAIDMTAGEKERRTLEILLCSPAGRNEIVLGKILAASTAAFLTATLNVASLTYSFRSGIMGPEIHKVLEGVRPNLGAVLLVLLAVLPTAVTAAAVMITISLFAKSFKEGQSYLTPLIMLVIFPAMIGMLPGVEANPLLAMLPVFNVTQLIKSIFNGEYTAASFLLPFGSNLLYAAVAFYMAVRIFKREDVLFRS